MSSQDPLSHAPSSSTPLPTERPKSPTHFGGDGLYASAADSPEATEGSATEGSATEGSASFEAPQDEHADSTPGSVGAPEGSKSGLLDFVKRHPMPAAVAAAGLVWLVASLSRSRR
jgi:hypothetical protein